MPGERLDPGPPHGGQPVLAQGKPLTEAKTAMILLHGRGATADSIMDLARYLHREDMAYLAPQAAAQTWYPFSFLAPIARNEPYLTSALNTVASLIERIEVAGLPAERIFLGGFSQGACLAAEFAARHARRYGGLLLFSGGLVGPEGTPRDYEGDFDDMPVFIGCSDVDPHIPLARVHETANILQSMGAHVDEQIYPDMDHTIILDEIDKARTMVEGVRG